MYLQRIYLYLCKSITVVHIGFFISSDPSIVILLFFTVPYRMVPVVYRTVANVRTSTSQYQVVYFSVVQYSSMNEGQREETNREEWFQRKRLITD